MTNGGRTYVGFGFGAIQAGLFLYEASRSGAFDRLVVAEVMPDRVASVRASNGYFGLNIAHQNGVESLTVGPIEIYDPAVATDRAALIAAIAEATEIGTAIPSIDYYTTVGPASLHRILAAGLQAKAECASACAVIYAAENNNHAAETMQAAVVDEFEDEVRLVVRQRVRFLNTVIGKMSGVVPVVNGLVPVTPGEDSAFLVEAFNRILISAIDFEQPFVRGISNFEEKSKLLPFEEAKLYVHNAGHAVAAYLALATGTAMIADMAANARAMLAIRRAMLDESGSVLVRAYEDLDPLFTPKGMTAYVDDLLTRMTNPYLLDTAARVGRDPARKLGWDDRLVGAIRLCVRYGVQPRALCMGTAAAVRVLRQETGDVSALSELLAPLWPMNADTEDERKRTFSLIDQGETALHEWIGIDNKYMESKH